MTTKYSPNQNSKFFQIRSKATDIYMGEVVADNIEQAKELFFSDFPFYPKEEFLFTFLCNLYPTPKVEDEDEPEIPTADCRCGKTGEVNYDDGVEQLFYCYVGTDCCP